MREFPLACQQCQLMASNIFCDLVLVLSSDFHSKENDGTTISSRFLALDSNFFLAKNQTPTTGFNGTMIQYPIGRRKRKGRSNTTWSNGKGEKWNLRYRIGEIEKTESSRKKKNTAL